VCVVEQKASDKVKKRENTIEKEQKRRTWIAKRRKEGMAFATMMGVQPIIDSLPTQVKEQVLIHRLPKMEVELDAASADSEETQMLCVRAQRLLETKQRLEDSDHKRPDIELSAQEFNSICRGIHHGLAVVAAPNERIHELMVRGSEQTASFIREVRDRLLESTVGQLLFRLAEASKLDHRIFWLDFSGLNGPETTMTVLIGSHVAKPQSIVIDGERREIYRLSHAIGRREPEPITIDAKLLGRQSGDSFPVFIQRHALQRLEQRLGPINQAAGLFICDALREPRTIVQDMPGKFLIEYRFVELKVGYLAATLLEGKLILTTFLFLTMDGTPEGRKLKEVLHIKRQELAYNKLDDIKTFTHTDVLENSTLATIFKECGCGDLIKLRERKGDTVDTPFAAEIKKYLRLDKRREQLLLSRLNSDSSSAANASSRS